jgi:quinol monooxygenase YgiN
MHMSSNISYVFEVAIKPGQLENFKALMKEMVEATQANEPKTLNYEWFISDDGTTCHTCERYADSAAVMTHMEAVRSSFSERYFAAAEPRRLVVYGNPSEEIKTMFGPLNALFLPPAAGFVR